VLPLLALTGFACDDDLIYVQPDPPDSGVVDAGFEPDAGEEPDAGFAPDAAEPPPADEPIYIHSGTTLFSYDPDRNTAEVIGDFRTARGPLDLDMVDIAIDTRGRMFGGSRQPGNETQGNRVYRIDPATAMVEFRFEFDDTLHGMTFLPDGRLVIAGERVSVVDPETGRVLLDYPAANDYQTSGDIVGLPDGKLYWTVRGPRDPGGAFGPDDVVRIDPTTGTIRKVGSARESRIYGLGYAEGSLYGFSSSGKVVVLDPDTGAVRREAVLMGRWFGATTNPVLW
jgi:outer membrane protein assembly factor BamB